MPDAPLTACPSCGKSLRSVLYCKRYPCGYKDRDVLAIDLPRPTVETTKTSDGKDHLVISRDGRGKSYEIEGSSDLEKVKNVVEKVISDRYTGEWLP